MSEIPKSIPESAAMMSSSPFHSDITGDYLDKPEYKPHTPLACKAVIYKRKGGGGAWKPGDVVRVAGFPKTIRERHDLKTKALTDCPDDFEVKVVNIRPGTIYMDLQNKPFSLHSHGTSESAVGYSPDKMVCK